MTEWELPGANESVPLLLARTDDETVADGADDAVVDLLSDEYNKQILRYTRTEPRSVSTLSELCDADPSTIYRRIDDLEGHGLLDGQNRLDPGGHHHTVYSASVREIHIRLEEDGFAVEVDRIAEESPADRFTRLYEGFK